MKPWMIFAVFVVLALAYASTFPTCGPGEVHVRPIGYIQAVCMRPTR